MLSLVLADKALLDQLLPGMIEEYKDDLVNSGAYASEEEALKTAKEEIDGYFYNGKLLPNQVIQAIFLAGVEEPIGSIWISTKSAQDPEKAFLCYIGIRPAYRGKGYAKRALLTAEKRLLKQGIDKLGLNVFAHNTPAIELYKKLKYDITFEVSLKSTGKITRYLLEKDLAKHHRK